MAEYPKPSLTADAVIFTDSDSPKLLLIRRGSDPYKGEWALPGGFVEEQATYSGVVPEDSEVNGADDAGEARWVPVDELTTITLAFDHDEIVRDALVLLG